jgi:hypothetical protein
LSNPGYFSLLQQWADLKGQIQGFQIGPISLKNIPVVQRIEQKDFGFSGMFNCEVIQVYI